MLNGDKFVLFTDGDKWCATRPDFVDLQQSHAAFGDTPTDAIKSLLVAECVCPNNGAGDCPACHERSIILPKE